MTNLFNFVDLFFFSQFYFSGSQLQICPRGLTCCTEDMEAKLRDDSQDKYKKALKTSANGVQRLFNSRAHKFDGEKIK